MHSNSQSPTSTLRTILLVIIITLVVAVIPARAQNAVPPTARQAAALPAFAHRLTPPTTRQAAHKFPASAHTRIRRASPLDQTVYDNGPVNGQVDAWTINFGFTTTDSIQVNGTVPGIAFWAWLIPGDTISNVEVQVGAAAFGNELFDSIVTLTQSNCFTNDFGYDVCLESAGFTSPRLDGNAWVTLANANVPSGDPVYWDENSGVGCESPGCPSQAQENTIGTIPSEAFTLTSGATTTTSTTGVTCLSSGGGLNIIHSFTQTENPHNGGSSLTIDSAGNPYGTTVGGDYDLGMVYKLAPEGQDWVLTTLYNFTGTYNGYLPWLVNGPEGALYGTAYYGGIQDCNQYGCGFVYRLRPAPTSCLTALCSWTENTLYRFAGNKDGANPATLAFDQEDNIYGATRAGGAYGQGVVYELTPSHGSWTEKVLYTFTGGNDGGDPGSLLVGVDGNLYGVADYGGAYGYGVVYQLVPSGGGWTQHVIYAFTGQGDGIYPGYLRKDSSGNLYGTSSYHYSWGIVPVSVFMLSPTNGGWVFTTIWRTQHDLEYIGGLAVDIAGNLYGVATNSGEDNDPAHLYFETFKRTPDGQFQGWGTSGVYFPAESGVVVDRLGNLYGSTGFCGTYGLGTVWQFSGFTD